MNSENKHINSKKAEKRILSANAPVINAGVIMANFNWKSANKAKGIVAAKASFTPKPTSLNMKKVSGFPKIPVPSPPILSPKAMLNPTKTQSRLMIPSAMKLCSMVEIRFLNLTIPA